MYVSLGSDLHHLSSKPTQSLIDLSTYISYSSGNYNQIPNRDKERRIYLVHSFKRFIHGC